ncbi:hypothetical protein PSAB6_230265 [Paraburkholderia sabiae]|nr:hypothetical protein PSAB6_230265 [Paraburkholderia sabiae]
MPCNPPEGAPSLGVVNGVRVDESAGQTGRSSDIAKSPGHGTHGELPTRWYLPVRIAIFVA